MPWAMKHGKRFRPTTALPLFPQQALLLNNIITGFGGPSTRGQSSPLSTTAIR